MATRPNSNLVPSTAQSVPPRRLARASAVALLTTVAVQGLNVLSGILLARMLGPAGKGLLVALLLWPGFLMAIGGLSVLEAVVYFTATRHDREREIAATALAIAVSQAIALCAIGFALTPVVLGHYGSEAIRGGRLYLAWIPIALVSLTALAILQGKLHLVAYQQLTLAGTLLTVTGLFGLYALHQFSVINVLLIYLAANIVVLLISGGLVIARGWLGLTFDAGLARSMLIYGVKAHGGALAGLTNQRADQMLIALFLSPASLGLYSVAVTVAAPPTMLGTALAFVAFPAVSGALTADEKRRHFISFVHVTLVMSTLTAALIVLLAPTLIVVLFGRPFAAAAPIAQVLLIAAVILGTSRPLHYGLKAFNYPFATSIAEASAAVVTIVALATLMPLLGLMGAAIASLAAYGVSMAYMARFVGRNLGISPVALLVPTRADFHWLRAQWRRWRAARSSQS